MSRPTRREDFLPVSRQDMEARGWDELDFLVVSGDAYVDHPSFGHAIIARVLEGEGYRVGILAQPEYHSPEAFLALGRPRLGVLVSAGNLDSMLNTFTARRNAGTRTVILPGIVPASGRNERPSHIATAFARRWAASPS